ncbi:MAG TPA: CRTAC1 family protein, partial [Pirellulales bacterium]
DVDGDGWQDILVANDGRPNHLWMNRQDGTFREEAVLRGIACNATGEPQANMGIAVGDVDGDGLFDVYITHLTEQRNVLWMQGPRGMFLDRTAVAGTTNAAWRGTGFGTVFADFDQDGWLDLAVVNGRVTRSRSPEAQLPPAPNLDPHWRPYAERNQLFAGAGAGKFRDISAECPGFCGQPNVARALAMGDVDGDGAIDLLATAVAEPVRLYRNCVAKRGHWLQVRAVEPALGGRDSYGAEITIQAGSRQQVGWVVPGSSYLVSNDPRVHFGLGEAVEVGRVEVVWPDGSREVFRGGPVDRLLEVRKGEGTSP